MSTASELRSSCEILDRQFAPEIIRRLESSASRKRGLIKKTSIRTEEDPKRVMAWAIAQRVREARERRGLKQDDLAKMTGIARPNIARIEQGRHIPSLMTLKRIADALLTDLNSLTALPVAAAGDRAGLTAMAESGMEEWAKSLEQEDKRH